MPKMTKRTTGIAETLRKACRAPAISAESTTSGAVFLELLSLSASSLSPATTTCVRTSDGSAFSVPLS